MTKGTPLKVVVMTQNDRFFIPKNILKAAQVCDIVEVVSVDCKSAMENRLHDYLNWFGFFQCAKMGMVTGLRTAQQILDRLSAYHLFGGVCGVQDAAKKLGVPHSVIHDSNAPDFVAHIRTLQPDLIISFSAPQIIKDELLSIPTHGIINVHGSLLPDYRGTLPSFWYLYNGEKTGGATVHYMSKKIDDGAIIRQGQVDISDCRTMFQLMKKTKLLGGDLMVQAIQDIANGTVSEKPNISSQGRYFTWPTTEQARQFRSRGCRLV